MPRRIYSDILRDRIPESTLHQQIADTFKLEIAPAGHISADGVVWWSQDIAAYSGNAPGLRTARGVIAGIPDLIVLYRGLAHFIEVKAPDGEFSQAQREVGAAILLSEARYGMARSAPEALQLLDAWDIPRKRRVKF